MNPQPRRPQDSQKTARTQDSHKTALTQDSQHASSKVTRLEGFDYSSENAYFVTFVTRKRINLFGEIVDEEMVLNDFGKIVLEEWERSAGIRKEIELGEFVIMPNHFHCIFSVRATGTPRYARVCNNRDRSPLQSRHPQEPTPFRVPTKRNPLLQLRTLHLQM